MGFTKPDESPRPLVRSYRTVSPLPRIDSMNQPFGGLLSAALSLTSRPVDVIDHPALRSPDFPPVRDHGKPRPTPAITPPTDSATHQHRPISTMGQAVYADSAIAAPTRLGSSPSSTGVANAVKWAVSRESHFALKLPSCGWSATPPPTTKGDNLNLRMVHVADSHIAERATSSPWSPWARTGIGLTIQSG
ncbi:hypothetical protein SAMN06265222_102488 [Neorhodopirellula lusitana]|uniref:Uncharacterized protein n=1 Tax=Neorhodopirellula lusitana TaxID=445327 RepID=A0ABY1PZ62_9BACT|nr:hypothetical protein SAMN06265222_102488 [Neorhodopirellula lusitana]